jgi:hypothetical protein
MYPAHLLTPPPPFLMVQIHDSVVFPMKVICQKGYLLVNTIEGVAFYPPNEGTSISILFLAFRTNYLGDIRLTLIDPVI